MHNVNCVKNFWVSWVTKYPSCEETPNILCSVSAHHIHYILFRLLSLVSVMKTDRIKALLFYIIWLNSPSCSCGKEKNSSFSSSFVCSCLTSSCWTLSLSALVSVSLFQLFKKVRKTSVCCGTSCFITGSVNTDTVQSVSQVKSSHCCTVWD